MEIRQAIDIDTYKVKKRHLILPSGKKLSIVSILSVLAVVLAIPFTIGLTQQNQDLRQHAAQEASPVTTGRIEGYKFVGPQNQPIAPAATSCITVESAQVKTCDEPYHFDSLPAKTYTIRADELAGYTLSYNWSLQKNTEGSTILASGKGEGTVATLDLRPNSVLHINWVYTPIPVKIKILNTKY